MLWYYIDISKIKKSIKMRKVLILTKIKCSIKCQIQNRDHLKGSGSFNWFNLQVYKLNKLDDPVPSICQSIWWERKKVQDIQIRELDIENKSRRNAFMNYRYWLRVLSNIGEDIGDVVNMCAIVDINRILIWPHEVKRRMKW